MLDIEDAQLKLKVSRILREVVRSQAKKSRRTINGEVAYQLERVYEAEIEKARLAATNQALNVNPHTV